jgi:hypothetical protein
VPLAATRSPDHDPYSDSAHAKLHQDILTASLYPDSEMLLDEDILPFFSLNDLLADSPSFDQATTLQQDLDFGSGCLPRSEDAPFKNGYSLPFPAAFIEEL